jgi:iron complex outermembrane receptor protein
LDIDLELVHDFEFGATYRDSRSRASVNFYWMEFNHEIVPFGGVNEDGLPITANADRSVHAGIELAAGASLTDRLQLSANFSYSYNRYKDFAVSEEYYADADDWEWLGYEGFRYDDNTIPGFPEYIGNFLVEHSPGPFTFVYRGRLVGRQYVENLNRSDLAIDPYMLGSVSVAVSLARWLGVEDMELSVALNNVFNKRYLAGGYGGVVRFRDQDDLSWAEYIPAAGRSIFTSLKLELR